MTTTNKRLLKMTDEEIIRIFDSPIGNCAYPRCGKEVRGSQRHIMVGRKVYHEYCYDVFFGDGLICSPGRRGIGVVMLDEIDAEALTA